MLIDERVAQTFPSVPKSLMPKGTDGFLRSATVHPAVLTIMIVGFKLSLTAAPDLPLFLHNTSFDGGLYWSTTLLRLELDANLYWDITVGHVTTECKFTNEMRSRWEIQGIENYLLFDNTTITWVSSYGNAICFSRNAVEQTGRSQIGNSYLLTKADDGRYVIRDPVNNMWFYEKGLLSRIEFASGQIAQCQCSDGIIKELSVNGKIIFSAQWDGNLLRISPFTGKNIIIEYENSRQMIRSITFEKDKTSEFVFSYTRKLVNSIQSYGKSINLLWEKVRFSFFPDESLDYPYYLKSDGYFTYNHIYFFGEYVLKATDPLGNNELRIMNLENNTITRYK